MEAQIADAHQLLLRNGRKDDAAALIEPLLPIDSRTEDRQTVYDALVSLSDQQFDMMFFRMRKYGFLSEPVPWCEQPIFVHKDLGNMYDPSMEEKLLPEDSCPFCEKHVPLEDEYGEYWLHYTELYPLTPIVLSGNVESIEEPPFASLFLYEDGAVEGEGEKASFPINYCPVCGKKLEPGVRRHRANFLKQHSDDAEKKRGLFKRDTVRQFLCEHCEGGSHHCTRPPCLLVQLFDELSADE